MSIKEFIDDKTFLIFNGLSFLSIGIFLIIYFSLFFDINLFVDEKIVFVGESLENTKNSNIIIGSFFALTGVILIVIGLIKANNNRKKEN